MARVVTFKIKQEGSGQIVKQQKQIADSINESTQALRRFLELVEQIEKGNLRLDSLNKKMEGLTSTLNSVLKQVSNGGLSLEDLDKAKQRTEGLKKEFEETGEQVKTTQQQLKGLYKELREGPVKSAEAQQELITQIARLKQEQKEVTQEIRRQQRLFEEQSFAEGSYRQLQAQLGRLRAEFRDLGEEAQKGIQGEKLLKEIGTLDKEVKRLDKQMGIYVRNVGNYRDAINKLSGIFAAIKGFELFGMGLMEVVENNAEFSDSLADVRKTTDLSVKSLEGYNDVILELSENLKGIDTRTSLTDLLDISRIGGQLGVVTEFVDEFQRLNELGDVVGAQEQLDLAQERLLGFTQAIDQANVALGEDLGTDAEGVALALGKIVGVTVDLEKEFDGNLEQGILAVGSAINSVGAKSQAQAGPIVNFVQRVGALGPQAKISSADLIGLGAAVDEFGLKPELASSAVTRFLLKIGEDLPKFAEIAGISVEELSQLLEQDGFAAFQKILKGAGESGDGLENLTKSVKALGIESVGEIQTITALAQKHERLGEIVDVANESYEEGTSLTDEFNVKNQTLGAALDKLRKEFKNLTTGQGFTEFLRQSVELLVKFVQGLQTLPQWIKTNAVTLGLLVVAFVAFNTQAQAGILSVLKFSRSLLVLNKTNKIVTVSTRLLNLAMKANPIGFVIGIIATLIGVLVYLYNNFDTVRERVNSLWEQFLELYESSVILKLILGRIVEPIKAIIFVIREWGAIWEAVKATFDAGIDNLVNNFKSLVNTAKIVGLSLKRAFTFDAEVKLDLDNQIQELKDQNKEYADAAQNLGTVFQENFEDARIRIAKEKEEERRAQAEREAQDLQSQGTPPPGDDGTGTGGGSGSGGGGQSLSDAEAEMLEERVENRRRAIEEIKRLENELQESETAISAGKILLDFEFNAQDLVGDPEQIQQQADLMRDQAVQGLTEVYDEARQTQIDEAQETLEQLGETQGLLPTPENLRESSDQITQDLRESNDRLFQEQEESLRRLSEERQRILTESSEGDVSTQLQQIDQELETQLEELRQRQQVAEEELIQAEQQRNIRLAELQIQSIEQRRQTEILAEEQDRVRRIQVIQEQVEEGIISAQEGDELIKETEDEIREERLESERQFLEQKAQVLESFGLQTIGVEAELARKELEITQDKVRKQLSEEKKLADGRKAIRNATLGFLSDTIKGTKALLSEDEENRKKYGKVLKALSLGEVAINLIREISAINAANTRFGEPIDTIIKVATIAKAVVQAGVAAVKIKNQELEFGGVVQGQFPQTPSLSSTLVSPEGDLLEDGGEGPNQGWSVVGPGNVPQEGLITGPSHRSGGVKMISRHGDLIEVEGNEFLLQNGPEMYVMNKRSTRKHRRLLEGMKGSPRVFSPEKRQLASQINSDQGWGVEFGRGRRIPVMAQSGISAPTFNPQSLSVSSLSPPTQSSPVLQQTETLEVMERQNDLLQDNILALDEKTDEINGRIDRLRVLSKPEEQVEAAVDEMERKDAETL